LIDAVIVDYGTPRLAARCAGSLDDGAFSSIELVDAKARGWSYARSVNSSLTRGSAPYVLALNADTRMLEPPHEILSLFEEHADIAIIGPRQIDEFGRVTHAGVVGTNPHPVHRFWLHPLAEVIDDCKERALDCVAVSGSVFFARRRAWEELGGFLETPHFFEETWLCYLARHRGYRVVYTGATTWLHLFGRSPTPDGWQAEVTEQSRAIFRESCAREGIECG
jgi:GT2 family glycosyltransferase